MIEIDERRGDCIPKKAETVTMASPTEDRIEITPEMIEAGISALRDFRFGQCEGEIVRAVYLAMAIEYQFMKVQKLV